MKLLYLHDNTLTRHLNSLLQGRMPFRGCDSPPLDSNTWKKESTRHLLKSQRAHTSNAECVCDREVARCLCTFPPLHTSLQIWQSSQGAGDNTWHSDVTSLTPISLTSMVQVLVEAGITKDMLDHSGRTPTLLAYKHQEFCERPDTCKHHEMVQVGMVTAHCCCVDLPLFTAFGHRVVPCYPESECYKALAGLSMAHVHARCEYVPNNGA